MTAVTVTDPAGPGSPDDAMAGEPARRGSWLRTVVDGRPLVWIALAVIAVMVVITIAPGPVAGLFGNGDPRVCDLSSSRAGPAAGHPFGFDTQGCDLYAQVIHGARPSIVIGVVATLGSMVIAVALGTVAGYVGGLVDTVIARLTDVFFGLPFLIGAIVILNAFPERDVATVCLALIALGWTTMTRLMRASVLALRDAGFIVNLRALGAGPVRIMVRHLIPNAISPVIVLATLTVGYVIAAEATLTFLGVGLRLPAISWGLILSKAEADIADHPHLLIFPGAFLSATVTSFMVLGDAVGDALDPSGGGGGGAR